MTPEAIETAAKVIAENRLNRTRLGPLPEAIRPPDLDGAYAVQEAISRHLAESGLGERVQDRLHR